MERTARAALEGSLSETVRALKIQSVESRLASLEMAYKAGKGHIPPDFSCMDIMTVLFFRVLRLNPQDPNWELRDRFILSKGHAVGALYVSLAARGFFPREWLETYQELHSRLPGHPDRSSLPGIEHNTGSLGHGLPVAAGMAAGLRLAVGDGPGSPRVYVLLGDGELQEGSNWEAAMTAAHQKLSRLTAIVDRNGLQQGDFTESTVRLEDLAAKWRSFGWTVVECDGHDIEALIAALDVDPSPGDAPRVVIAKTVKGKGARVMENHPAWHHRIPNAEEYAQAKRELSEVLEALRSV